MATEEPWLLMKEVYRDVSLHHGCIFHLYRDGGFRYHRNIFHGFLLEISLL